MAKDCPKCRLVNPDTAERCDCGYAFALGAMDPSIMAAHAESRRVGRVSIGVGVAMIGAGILASLVTVASLEGGGYLFYGLVIAGVVAIVRGVRQR